MYVCGRGKWSSQYPRLVVPDLLRQVPIDFPGACMADVIWRIAVSDSVSAFDHVDRGLQSQSDHLCSVKVEESTSCVRKTQLSLAGRG